MSCPGVNKIENVRPQFIDEKIWMMNKKGPQRLIILEGPHRRNLDLEPHSNTPFLLGFSKKKHEGDNEIKD